jgi:hypothetical protein
MSAARKQAQHAGGVVCVGWLREHRAIHNHRCIRAEHQIILASPPNGEGFLASEPFDAGGRRFFAQGSFVDVGGLHGKYNSGAAEKVLAARRGGSEHKHSDSILSK